MLPPYMQDLNVYAMLILFFQGSRRLPHFWSPDHRSMIILPGESLTPAFLILQLCISAAISVLHILLGPWKSSSTHAFLVLQAGGHFMATPFHRFKFCWAHRSSVLLQLLSVRFRWVHGTSMLVQLLNVSKCGLHASGINARPEQERLPTPTL